MIRLRVWKAGFGLLIAVCSLGLGPAMAWAAQEPDDVAVQAAQLTDAPMTEGTDSIGCDFASSDSNRTEPMDSGEISAPAEQALRPEQSDASAQGYEPAEQPKELEDHALEPAQEPVGSCDCAAQEDKNADAAPECDQPDEMSSPAATNSLASDSGGEAQPVQMQSPPACANAVAEPIVEKTSLAKAKVSTSKRRLYNGKRIKPKVEVVLDGKKLKLNRDFKVSYKNNKKVGKATIIIKGIGGYTGKITKKFKIVSQLVIAVPDRSASAASGLIRYLRSLGFKCVWVNSSKIDPAKYDGLAIPGDPSDVDPRFYGEKNKHARTPHPKTEKMQFKLIKKFAKANKPVLGICKGCQIINVAYGGSLHQDLGGYHRQWQTTYIKKGSWLRKKLDSQVSVYHYHHQAVKRLAKNFKVMAWSKKGKRKIIEGIEHKTLPVWGIQFHPEYSGKYGKIIGNMYKKEILKRM